MKPMPYKLINPTTVEENLTDNTALIRQFIELYQVQIPVDLLELKEAVMSKAHNDIANKAHHIKPTMEYIGARTLWEKLQQLDYAGNNKADIAYIEDLFLEIEQEITDLLQEISDYRQTLL